MKNTPAPRAKKALAALFFVALGLALALSLVEALLPSEADPLGLLSLGIRVLAATAILFLLLSEGMLALSPRFCRDAWIFTATLFIFLVAINNFPFYDLLTGRTSVTVTPLSLLVYTATALATACFEELLFRGLLFPLVCERMGAGSRCFAANPQSSQSSLRGRPAASLFAPLCHSERSETKPNCEAAPPCGGISRGKKFDCGLRPSLRMTPSVSDAQEEGKREKRAPFGGLLAPVLLSSALFALLHLVNLTVAPVGDTLLQVAYTFGIGILSSLLYLFSRSLLFPVAFHAIYNFGGLYLSAFGGTNDPALGTILFTTALALTAAALSARALARFAFRHEDFTN